MQSVLAHYFVPYGINPNKFITFIDYIKNKFDKKIGEQSLLLRFRKLKTVWVRQSLILERFQNFNTTKMYTAVKKN
jgi:uncharacterized protein YktA (UPF0223 family)